MKFENALLCRRRRDHSIERANLVVLNDEDELVIATVEEELHPRVDQDLAVAAATTYPEEDQDVRLRPLALDHKVMYGHAKKQESQSYSKGQRTPFSKAVCGLILATGLCLYVGELGINIALAQRYLSMRQCHRSISGSFQDFRLDRYVDLESLLSNIQLPEAVTGNLEHLSQQPDPVGPELATEDNGPEAELLSSSSSLPSILGQKVADFIDNAVLVRLGQEDVKVFPRHWKQHMVDVVSFQMGRKRISDMCLFNGNNLTGLPEVAAYVCSNTMKDNTEEERKAIMRAIQMLIPTTSEDAVVQAMVAGNFWDAIDLVLLGDQGDQMGKAAAASSTSLLHMLAKFKSVFQDSQDLDQLVSLLGNPLILGSLSGIMDAAGKIDQVNLDGAMGALSHVQPDSMSQIQALLQELNVTMTSLVGNPGIMFKFLSDPAKLTVMYKIQQLMPKFTPKEINDILVVKAQLDKSVSQSDKLFEYLLSLPAGLLTKIFAMKPTREEAPALVQVLDRFFKSQDIHVLINFALYQWKLQTPSGRTAFVAACRMPTLKIQCVDTSEDICQDGQKGYGTATAVVLALPGLILALSEFFHSPGFSFGGSFIPSLGTQWNLSLRLLAFPFYAAAMVFLMPLIIVSQYINSLRVLLKQKLHPEKWKIGGDSDNLGMTTKDIDLLNDFSLRLHSVWASSHSYLQILNQIYFLVLLVAMGGATMIAGVDSAVFFGQIFPLTVASLVFCGLDLFYVSWQRHQRELWILSSANESKPLKVQLVNWVMTPPETSHCSNYSGGASTGWYVPSWFNRRKFWGVFGRNILAGQLVFLMWFLMQIVLSVASTIALCLFVWIEVFSKTLLTDRVEQVTTGTQIVCLAILCFPIPANLVLHWIFRCGRHNSFSLANWLLSAVFPLGFVDCESYSNTKKYLIWNQAMWWISHVLAWLVYAASCYNQYKEETFFAKIIPLVASTLGLVPALAAIHWSCSIKPRYSQSLPDVDSNQVKPMAWNRLDTSKQVLVMAWAAFTAAVRVVSLALLIYIFQEHWAKVTVTLVGLQLAVIETVPLALLLILANVSLQFALGNRSVCGGLLGTLAPNGYIKGTPGSSKYILLNYWLNGFLHLALYTVLTFYCWECTKILSLDKLMMALPAVVVLWAADLTMAHLIWFRFLRKIVVRKQDVVKSITIQGLTPADEEVSGNTLNFWMSQSSINTPL